MARQEKYSYFLVAHPQGEDEYRKHTDAERAYRTEDSATLYGVTLQGDVDVITSK